MAFRNWQQELVDERPPRPSPWPFLIRVVVALVIVSGGTCCALWAWPGYLLPKPWTRPGPAPESIALMFTGDCRGYLEPCGCTEQRWGGVARLGGILRQINKPTATLMVDTGDMTSGNLLWQRIALEYYLKALGRLGYAAANLGAGELTLSAADLRQLAESSPVPLVSANVRDAATGEPLVAPYRKLMIENLRVTLLGVVDPDPKKQIGEGLLVDDIDESIGQRLTELRPHTDLIVLLAACDEDRMRRIAVKHPEIDVIIGGRVRQASRQVETVGSCRIVYQANTGQMLGRIDIRVRPDGLPEGATCAMLMLKNDVPEDSAMLELIEDYNGRLAMLSRTKGLAALGVETIPQPAGGNTYVGPRQCKACHETAYTTWQESRHAKAWQSLADRRRDGNPDCISCHVLDFGAGDGFRGIGVSPAKVNVQCESCHTRAREHVRARRAEMDPKIGRKPPVLQKSCESCHDCDHSPEFSYQTYWEKMEHGQDKDNKSD